MTPAPTTTAAARPLAEIDRDLDDAQDAYRKARARWVIDPTDANREAMADARERVHALTEEAIAAQRGEAR